MTIFNLGFLISPLLSPLLSPLVSPLAFDSPLSFLDGGIGAGSESSRFLRIKSSARLFLLFCSSGLGDVTISVARSRRRRSRGEGMVAKERRRRSRGGGGAEVKERRRVGGGKEKTSTKTVPNSHKYIHKYIYKYIYKYIPLPSSSLVIFSHPFSTKISCGFLFWNLNCRAPPLKKMKRKISK